MKGCYFVFELLLVALSLKAQMNPATAVLIVMLFAALSFVWSDEVDGFKVLTDGSRAIFSFRDSDWDAVFGTISLREMNDTLTFLLVKVNELQQEVLLAHTTIINTQSELNLTRDELKSLKAQQDVCLW